jgi:hypothetical protein
MLPTGTRPPGIGEGASRSRSIGCCGVGVSTKAEVDLTGVEGTVAGASAVVMVEDDVVSWITLEDVDGALDFARGPEGGGGANASAPSERYSRMSADRRTRSSRVSPSVCRSVDTGDNGVVLVVGIAAITAEGVCGDVRASTGGRGVLSPAATGSAIGGVDWLDQRTRGACRQANYKPRRLLRRRSHRTRP